MNAERILIAAECVGDARWFVAKASAYATEREVFGRPIGQNQGVQFPIARAHVQTEAAALMVAKAAALVRRGREVRRRGEHGQAARVGGVDGGGRRLHPDAWRLRLRRGVRHRAQVPRDAALPSRADLDELDPVATSARTCSACRNRSKSKARSRAAHAHRPRATASQSRRN